MMDMGKYLCSELSVEELESEGDRGWLTNYTLKAKISGWTELPATYLVSGQ